MGETAVAMPRPADISVGRTPAREAPRTASAPPPPPNHSTPLQEDRLKIRETEEAALAATKKEIDEARARNKAKTETPDTKPPAKTASQSPPPDAAPQLPSGVTQADIDRLQQNIANKVMTEQEAGAELEKLVNKAVGMPTETHMAPPVPHKKKAHNDVAPTSSKASSSKQPPIEHKTENSFLSKIKNITEKIFSIPTAIWRYLTDWITK